MKYTSAAANKLIKQLKDERDFYLSREAESKTYVAAVDETPVVPEFDYTQNAKEIERLETRIML